MEFITDIFNEIIHDFNFSIMVIINIATYIIIKMLDEINGDKVINVWIKRIVFIAVSIVIAFIYIKCSEIATIVIINSCIIAPISWSWIFKPIVSKLGIDYKQLNN